MSLQWQYHRTENKKDTVKDLCTSEPCKERQDQKKAGL
jgi:hypothetical protein